MLPEDMDVSVWGIPGCVYGVLRESGCIYRGPEQRALGNKVCKHMAFEGLQAEAQVWGVCGVVVEVRLRCVSWGPESRMSKIWT